jgi:hypothetical protein
MIYQHVALPLAPRIPCKADAETWRRITASSDTAVRPSVGNRSCHVRGTRTSNQCRDVGTFIQPFQRNMTTL